MDENKKVCETCKYFQQHFCWTGRKFRVVYCGYCRPPRSQPRRPRPDQPACRFYEENKRLPKRLWSREDPLTVFSANAVGENNYKISLYFTISQAVLQEIFHLFRRGDGPNGRPFWFFF